MGFLEHPLLSTTLLYFRGYLFDIHPSIFSPNLGRMYELYRRYSCASASPSWPSSESGTSSRVVCFVVPYWKFIIYAHLLPDPPFAFCIVVQNPAVVARRMVLKSPRLRIKRPVVVAQLMKGSHGKRPAARKTRTGDKASSSTRQGTPNDSNITGEVDIGDLIDFLREEYGCRGTSTMRYQARQMTVMSGFSCMNLFC